MALGDAARGLAARSLAGLAGPRLGPAVAATVKPGAAVPSLARRPAPARWGAAGLAVWHQLAGGHLLVAVHLHAHLRRFGGPAGGGRGAGLGAVSGLVLRRCLCTF